MSKRLQYREPKPARPAAALSATLALLALIVLSSPTPPARASGLEPGSRLGLSAGASSGGLLGFIDRDRLRHSRSLSFGYATSSGSSRRQQGGASYTDSFSYRLRDNLLFDLALEYNFSSSFRSATEERGQFSVLPSFALEYHPSQNSLFRFSYERLGPGSPYFSGRRLTPY